MKHKAFFRGFEKMHFENLEKKKLQKLTFLVLKTFTLNENIHSS